MDNDSNTQANIRRAIMSGATLALWLWLCFAALNKEMLLSLPYWDASTGAFREAFWLIDNHWDWNKLALNESGYRFGGPRTYFFSWYPALISLLFSTGMDREMVFVMLHLLIGSCYCITIGLCSGLGALAGLSRSLILLLAVAVSLFPVMLAQSASLNMDMLLACLSVAVLFLTAVGAHKQALIILFFAVFLKAPAIIPAFAILLTFVICHVATKGRYKFGSPIGSLIVLAIFLTQLTVEKVLFKNPGRDDQIINPYRILLEPRLIADSLVHLRSTPDLLFVLIYGVLLSCLLGYKAIFKLGNLMSLEKSLEIKESAVQLLLCVYVLVWSAATICHTKNLPRYFVCVIPIILVIIITVMKSSRPLSMYVVFVSMIAFSIFNVRGDLNRFLWRIGLPNDGFIQENTLFFLSAIDRDKDMTTLLSTLPQRAKISSPRPMSFALQDPRYGYLDTTLSHEVLTYPFKHCSPCDDPECVSIDLKNIFGSPLLDCDYAQLSLSPLDPNLDSYVIRLTSSLLLDWQKQFAGVQLRTSELKILH